jgi:hypothetical protein
VLDGGEVQERVFVGDRARPADVRGVRAACTRAERGKGGRSMKNYIQLARVVVEEAKRFKDEPAHAPDLSSLVIFDGQTFHICDNGEEVDTDDFSEAVRILSENLEGNMRDDDEEGEQ